MGILDILWAFVIGLLAIVGIYYLGILALVWYFRKKLSKIALASLGLLGIIAGAFALPTGIGTPIGIIMVAAGLAVFGHAIGFDIISKTKKLIK